MAVCNASSQKSVGRLHAAHKRDCMEYRGAMVNGIARSARHNSGSDTQEAGNGAGAAVGVE